MEGPFFGKPVQNSINFFQIHLFKERLNLHLAAVMLQVMPSFHSN